MLKETKLALRIKTDEYDAEIADLLLAGARELETMGVVIPGRIAFSENAETGAITDDSTMDDPLIRRAIITYARHNFGSPSDAERLRDSWEHQKGMLMHAAAYTNYEEG